jgi:hypothetical protein
MLCSVSVGISIVNRVVEIGGGAKELVEKDSLLLKYKEGLLGTIDEL